MIENVKKSEKTDAWNIPAVSAFCCEWILLGFIVRETPATFTLMWERPGHSGKIAFQNSMHFRRTHSEDLNLMHTDYSIYRCLFNMIKTNMAATWWSIDFYVFESCLQQHITEHTHLIHTDIMKRPLFSSPSLDLFNFSFIYFIAFVPPLLVCSFIYPLFFNLFVLISYLSFIPYLPPSLFHFFS